MSTAGFKQPTVLGDKGVQLPQFAVHLCAGTVAGVGQIVVGHPLDTIKVKMQASTVPVNAFQLTASTFKAEGIPGLYRGLSSMLGVVAACNATLFASKGLALNALRHEDGSPPALKDHVTASMFAGGCSATLSSPAELVKCRLQHQGAYDLALQRFKIWESTGRMGAAPTTYKGPSDVVWTILRKEGGMLGMATGLRACMLRDSVGCGAMFAVYESLKSSYVRMKGLRSTQDVPLWALVAAGGLGGIACWTVVYPVDIIKSKLQVQSAKFPEYRGILDCGVKLYRSGGLACLYKGIGPCLVRAVPANGVAFLLYEQTAKWLNTWAA